MTAIEPTGHAEPTTEPPSHTPTPTVPPGDTPELVLTDPATLVLRDNIRVETRLDKGFVGHVKDHGVLVPIVAHRTADGELVVHTGHRRTLAAVRAGLTRVPVLVLPERTADDRTAEITRIVDQLGENEHRDAITDLEQVGAHQRLLDLGLSERQIVRRTRTGTNRVRASLAVAGATAARDAMTRLSLTLDQAAVLAEFDDDPDAITKLAEAAGTHRFDHLAQRLRDEQEERRLRAELTAQLTDNGTTVIDPPDPRQGLRRLSTLRATPEHRTGQELTIGEHTTCPGHVVWLEDGGSWRPAGERLYPVYGCLDWQTHGHADLHAPTGQTTEPGQRQPGPMTEQQKAERREVIANNKAWDSATTVRRGWLREFLTRRTPPTNAPGFIARTLLGDGHALRRALEDGHRLACELLGQTDRDADLPSWSRAHLTRLTELLDTAPPGRATMITLGLLLGALEDATSRATWRNPTSRDRAYFTALRDWGYPLADVEAPILHPTESDTATEPADPADPADQPGADPLPEPAQSNDGSTAPDDLVA